MCHRRATTSKTQRRQKKDKRQKSAERQLCGVSYKGHFHKQGIMGKNFLKSFLLAIKFLVFILYPRFTFKFIVITYSNQALNLRISS